MDDINYENIINKSLLMLKIRVEEVMKYACDKILEDAKRRQSNLEVQLEMMENDLERISMQAKYQSKDYKTLKEKCKNLEQLNAEQAVEIKVIQGKVQQRDGIISAYQNRVNQGIGNKLEIAKAETNTKNKITRFFSKTASFNNLKKDSSQVSTECDRLEFVDSKTKSFKNLLVSNDSNLKCSICKELFVFSTVTNCGHIFCEDCIQKWTEIGKTCPICRVYIIQQIPINDLDYHIEKCVEYFMGDATKDERLKLQKERKLEKDKREKIKLQSRGAPRKLSLGSIGNTQILVDVDHASISSSNEEDFDDVTSPRYHRLPLTRSRSPGRN